MPYVYGTDASTAFRTTFVTTRTPLIGAERGEANIIFRKNEREIFLRAELERNNGLDALHEIRFFAHALPDRLRAGKG